MTKEENKKYYNDFLKNTCGFAEEEINIMFEEYPFNETAVKERDRKEGMLIEGHSWHDTYLLLYRTKYKRIGQKNEEAAWVGVNKKNGKLHAILTKHISNYYTTTELSPAAIRNYLRQYRLHQASDVSIYGGETLIKTALTKIGFGKAFEIQAEYPIPELKNPELWKASPRFDFAVLDKDTKKPLMFFEYDGEQHYHQLQNKDYDFLQQFLRDQAKNGYAFYSMVPLIRIPYGLQNEEGNVDKVIKGIMCFLKGNINKGE